MVLIREFRDDDARAVRQCIVELQEAERRIDERLRPGESMASVYLEHMLAECAKRDGTILVAESDGAFAGFVTILTRVVFESPDDPPGEYALISDLVVATPFRHRGVGLALLREAESRASSSGALEVRVEVLAANTAATELYRRAGFRPYLETLAKRFDRPAT